MKDEKIPVGWLLPIAGFLLLLGWLLARSGWSVTEVEVGGVKLAPPTAMTIIAQSTAVFQEAPQQTILPDTSPPIVSESDLTPVPTTASTSAPTIIPTLTPDYFTVSDAESVQISENCNYWTEPLDIFNDGTDSNKNAVVEWDLKDLPTGIVIGDASMVEIDGQVLGSSGVTFFITMPTPGNGILRLRDGVFFIVRPGDAEGALRLRQRHLECMGNYQAIVRYP